MDDPTERLTRELTKKNPDSMACYYNLRPLPKTHMRKFFQLVLELSPIRFSDSMCKKDLRETEAP